MKSHLKLIPAIVGLASIPHALLAADTTTAYTTYTTNTRAPLSYATPNSIAASASNAITLSLNAQALLLKEMIQEHQKRAADLAQKSQSERAKWETELVSELQEKSDQLQKSIAQASQPWPGTNGLKAAGDLDHQLVFVATVEARLEQLNQELSAAIEDSRGLAIQMGTNKAPEEFAGMSLALGENQRLVKELQREQLDLELRKLEFRAICKVMQK